MPAMDYAAATGVRARTDLSANARALPPARLSARELVLIAEQLAAAARAGREFRLSPVLSGRVADAILETVNRQEL